MQLNLSTKINEGVLQGSKKISKSPKISSSPCRTGDRNDPLGDFDKGNLTFPEAEKIRYMELFKAKLRDIFALNLTLEVSGNITWANLLKELSQQRFDELIVEILPSSIFAEGRKVQVLRKCRKNVRRWFENENNQDNRGGRLVHEEDEEYFYSQVKMIIKGMTERKPAELQEKVQVILDPLLRKYGKELKGNEFSKNKKSAYLNENPKLKTLWERLPYPKKGRNNEKVQEPTTAALYSERVENGSPLNLNWDFNFEFFSSENNSIKTYEERQKEFFDEGTCLCDLSKCGFDFC